MKRWVVVLAALLAAVGSVEARGPYGTINVGNWKGGAFTNDQTGAFSHCGATAVYQNGIVGVVAAKLNAIKVARATGSIPENINFAIKTGALRDFLDNSVVPYQTAEMKAELKTTDIACNARGFTLLISCKAKQTESAKK